MMPIRSPGELTGLQFLQLRALLDTSFLVQALTLLPASARKLMDPASEGYMRHWLTTKNRDGMSTSEMREVLPGEVGTRSPQFVSRRCQ